MKFLGLDTLVFAVEDMAGCSQYLLDYGLIGAGTGLYGNRFEALDGTGIELAKPDAPGLPAPINDHCMLRKTIFGLADEASVQAIAEELGTDREVLKHTDGSLESVDDTGFALGFQVSVRTKQQLSLAGELSNAPYSAVSRPVNHIGVDANAGQIRPQTLSHVVYFVPDVPKAEAFYTDRLGFRCTDRFTGVGPFLQPQGMLDHHTHFLIGAPEFMTGVEHFTFHFAGPSEVMQNGSRFVEKGYQAFWGPGRHNFGSNWFWYFNSPFGCHMEMDADMDLHDTSWVARETPISADASQAFLLGYRKKWFPGPGTPDSGDYA